MIERGTKQYKELVKRMDVLYRKHYVWLLQASINITKNREHAEDLIGELTIYLMEKGDKSIYYKDSFNLLYCHRFLSTRWLNHVNRSKKIEYTPHQPSVTIPDEVYNHEEDERIMEAYELVQEELKRLTQTRMWPQERLFSLYHMSDDTMLEVANKIGLSKSTVFMSLKKIREHLKNTIQNPFQP